MGFFEGLGEVVVSPIKITTKSIDKAINVESIGEEAREINDKFEEELKNE